MYCQARFQNQKVFFQASTRELYDPDHRVEAVLDQDSRAQSDAVGIQIIQVALGELSQIEPER